MNYEKYILIGLIGAGAILTTGCVYDKTAPEPAATQQRVDWPSSASFQTQADNAVLCSMTVADIHFVPYQAELNSLGRTRLAAIASYLERHGGEVTVDSPRSDELTRRKRLASVREFLLAQGLNDEDLAITAGLTRGRGQDATEATLFYAQNLMGESSAPPAAQALTQAAPSAGGEEKE